MSESEAFSSWNTEVHSSINFHGVPESIKRNYRSCRVYMAALTANILMVASGFNINWTAPVLPMLLSNNTDINPLGRPISTLEVSFLTSAPHVTGLFGFLIMAKVSDRFGRKRTMMYSAMIHAISFNAIAFASEIYIYYISLLLVGFSFSGILVTVPTYNVEISDKHNRSRLGGIVGVGLPIGVLVSFLFGSITNVKIFSIITAIPALVFLLLAPFIIIESPVYFCLRGKKNEALISLESLRKFSNHRDIEIKYLRILSNIKMIGENKSSVFDLFETKASRKALLLSLFLCVGQQTSGNTLLITFVGIIFKDIGSSLSGETVGILLGLEQVVVVISIIYFINRFDRRYFMLASSLLASFSLFILSLYLFLEYNYHNLIEHIRWLPAVSSLVFMLAYNLGYGPLSVSLSGELFSNNLRSIGLGVSMTIESIFAFIVKLTFPIISKASGIHVSLSIFGIAGLVNFTVFYLFLPKTKEKSLGEVQKILAE